MDIRPIRTDADHSEALREIERLIDFPDGSPENDKLDVLVTLVSDYEDRRWPVGDVSAQEVLRFAVQDMGRTQAALAEVLGSRSMASELLSGKRDISLDAARKISAAWRIPIAALLGPVSRAA